jgi:hypothetical protein
VVTSEQTAKRGTPNTPTLENLPLDISLKIFFSLSLSDAISLGKFSKTLAMITKEPYP